MEPEVLFRKVDVLGEGSTYDERRRRVYWVDIKGRKFHYLSLGASEMRTFQSKGMISSIVPTTGEEMAATVDHGLYLIDESGGHRLLLEVEKDQGATRFNDGKADPFGNYVAGTMDLEERRPIGSLYVISGSTARRILSGLVISNGIAWDTGRRVFYHIDTPRRKVDAYSYDSSMNIEWLGTAVDFRNENGNPDGMTIDADGNLWVAHWGGSRVSVHDPERKRKVDEIVFPAKNITSCVFAGDGLSDLYVTSASSNEPGDMGGSLFVVHTDYEGSRTFRFRVP
ncbi:gluconolaconase [Thermogymnomonas acidicola]|uniref:Gluconolaconase n=1 Tax=Thermogymnomonas acidicola TaxID=399579 RepID=A0AA37BSL6_9ARCH|nr:SMP-30/gluconolactonase/LRE family protein [Thermogymnomonas acidicola]GGM78840.1 gluconolaconase [Thermogymnomonas acidicola]